MPEVLEVEMYRRAIGGLVGQRLIAIDASPRWARRAPDLDRLSGRICQRIDRIGKVIVVSFDDGDPRWRVAVRPAMTGRVVVDRLTEPRIEPVRRLRYGPARGSGENVGSVWHFEKWRVGWFDSRQLGGLEQNPCLDALGPDALGHVAPGHIAPGHITPGHVAPGHITPGHGAGALLARLRGSRPIKSALLDQSVVAGLGNLLVDEVLWRGRVHPLTPASAIDPDRLAAVVRSTCALLAVRGGSHRGVVSGPRNGLVNCPRCTGPWRRRLIGGRTTWWCDRCQPAVAVAPDDVCRGCRGAAGRAGRLGS